ncbi:MAG TPA: translocation/assembly module TamB domain-containing protein, partial [Stellaceae bacterium]|nr:translocation/assembly module TamB domain-containing protein [Stellaceae bacterium]
EWRGDLTVGGTSAAPAVTGRLQSTRGTVSLLGTDFTFDHGIIYFTGTAQPNFDIGANAAASGITATVSVTGTPDHPKLALSSVPALPQDEVLSHVMFGSSKSQLSPAQGLQLASAVATLTQGGPSMLDRLRNVTGLDRLAVGQSSQSTANTGQGGSSVSSGTSISGGKYVAPGVFVGAEQRFGGGTRARVEVQIAPSISATATAGTAGSGSSIGVQYQRDY